MVYGLGFSQAARLEEKNKKKGGKGGLSDKYKNNLKSMSDAKLKRLMAAVTTGGGTGGTPGAKAYITAELKRRKTKATAAGIKSREAAFKQSATGGYSGPKTKTAAKKKSAAPAAKGPKYNVAMRNAKPGALFKWYNSRTGKIVTSRKPGDSTKTANNKPAAPKKTDAPKSNSKAGGAIAKATGETRDLTKIKAAWKKLHGSMAGFENFKKSWIDGKSTKGTSTAKDTPAKKKSGTAKQEMASQREYNLKRTAGTKGTRKYRKQLLRSEARSTKGGKLDRKDRSTIRKNERRSGGTLTAADVQGMFGNSSTKNMKALAAEFRKRRKKA